MNLSYSTREKAAIAVFASGTSTMGVEILAGRLLAPQFGSSIYTWGSIIGVFMTALSLGYYFGGKRAEEHASYTALQYILAYAAGYLALLILFGNQLLQFGAALPVSPRYAALLPVTLLFGPPVFILGFVTPYAAQLSRKHSTGEASGYVFSIGTVGSITGAFLTTFLLIPTMSVESIKLLYGLVLVAGAVAVQPPKRLVSRQIGLAAATVTILLVGFMVQTTGFSVSGDTIHHTQTPYQELAVKDDSGVRTMYLNDHPQSAMYLNESDAHVWRYTRYFHLPYLMKEPEEIDNVLFIGGGGFTGPKRFVNDYNVTVDVVEIDPDVVDAAETYFDVEESEDLNIHVMDGRAYLRQTNKTYDLIVLDAYQKSSVPFHLTTEEFLQLASRKMSDDGILMANLISSKEGSGSEFYKAQYATMQRVYPNVYSFPTSQSRFTQNIELIATKQPERISQDALQQRNQERDIGVNLSEEITFYQDSVDTSDAPVLTDDRAPVDTLMDPLLGTEYVIEE